MPAREDVEIAVGGDRLAAWLHRPGQAGSDPACPAPCVVLAHGFTATREGRLAAYAERFAAAGLAALVFDYRGFGGSTGEPRDVVDVAAQHEDWRAAVAFARRLDGVDPERVALWGSSFSGGHVAVIASEDRRIAAVVSQAPYADGLAVLRAMAPAHAARLTLEGLRDELGARRGRPPRYLPTVGPPGSSAFLTSPDAEPGFRAVMPADWPNRAAARIALRLSAYRPVTKARRVACPWLVQVADRDTVTPPGPARRAAALAPRGELRHHDALHFEVYLGAHFERVCGEQVAFLTEHLLGDSAA